MPPPNLRLGPPLCVAPERLSVPLVKISQRARDGCFGMPGCGETGEASGREGEERGDEWRERGSLSVGG